MLSMGCDEPLIYLVAKSPEGGKSQGGANGETGPKPVLCFYLPITIDRT
jgi:hypothetical protein